MNIILVDTYDNKIYRVDVGKKLTLERIYKLLRCQCIEAHALPEVEDHAFYCDEEATLKPMRPPALFLNGFENPIYGNIMIFKSSNDFEISPTISVREVFSMVFFIP
jgi:hypothetical protein